MGGSRVGVGERVTSRRLLAATGETARVREWRGGGRMREGKRELELETKGDMSWGEKALESNGVRD